MKIVKENINSILRGKSPEEVYLTAKEKNKLGLLQGWNVIVEYPSQNIIEYLKYFEDLDRPNTVKFTRNKDETKSLMHLSIKI